MTKTQGYILIIALITGVILSGYAFTELQKSEQATLETLAQIKNSVAPISGWEYKAVAFYTAGNSRTGSEALKFSSVDLKADVIDKLGKDGWELVSNYLEMETAFPNFGRDDLVTGLQPNIRPQNLVLIFKRPVRR